MSYTVVNHNDRAPLENLLVCVGSGQCLKTLFRHDRLHNKDPTHSPEELPSWKVVCHSDKYSSVYIVLAEEKVKHQTASDTFLLEQTY